MMHPRLRGLSLGRKKRMGDGMRALKIATVVMGVLIVVGTIGLLVGLVRRSSAPPVTSVPALPVPGAPVPMLANADLGEPAGTRITGIAAVQDRLAVQLQGGGPDRVVLVDPRTGAVVGRIFAGH